MNGIGNFLLVCRPVWYFFSLHSFIHMLQNQFVATNERSMHVIWVVVWKSSNTLATIRAEWTYEKWVKYAKIVNKIRNNKNLLVLCLGCMNGTIVCEMLFELTKKNWKKMNTEVERKKENQSNRQKKGTWNVAYQWQCLTIRLNTFLLFSLSLFFLVEIYKVTKTFSNRYQIQSVQNIHKLFLKTKASEIKDFIIARIVKMNIRISWW